MCIYVCVSTKVKLTSYHECAFEVPHKLPYIQTCGATYLEHYSMSKSCKNATFITVETHRPLYLTNCDKIRTPNSTWCALTKKAQNLHPYKQINVFCK